MTKVMRWNGEIIFCGFGTKRKNFQGRDVVFGKKKKLTKEEDEEKKLTKEGRRRKRKLFTKKE